MAYNVIILDILLKQEEKGDISSKALTALHDNYDKLIDVKEKGVNALKEWFKARNGKEMRGASRVFPIFKYRVTKSERILYTFGKYLQCIRKEDAESIVLLKYAKHDEQANAAQSTDFDIRAGYIFIEDYDEYMQAEIEFEDGEEIKITSKEKKNINLAFTNSHEKCYALTRAQLLKISPTEIDKHAYLSPEQKTIIDTYIYTNDQKPTLILGGAGTGKTLIAIHLLNSLCSNTDKNYTVGYFTQSNPLLGKVKEQYEKIKTSNNKPDFWNINDFCAETLNLKNYTLVDRFIFDKIYNQIATTKMKNLCGSLDVWTEIRGVLKGGMDENWKRLLPFNQQDFGDIKNLEKNGNIKRYKNPKHFSLINFSEDELNENDKTVLKNIKNEYDKGINPNTVILDKEDYLNLKSEFSIFDKGDQERRNLIYDFCLQYQNYIENNKDHDEILIDENDLVRKYFKNFSENIAKYDFVIVDEVQDYTELQLYLLYRLSKKIIFAGDIHQNVNPTIFSEEKLEKLFLKNNKSELIIQTLKDNYRCQKNIIKVANNLTDFRKIKLGNKKQFLEQKEESVTAYAPSIVYRLEYSEKNLNKLMQIATTYAGIGIIVPNENQKELLTRKLNTNVAHIFTISEIKGMEFQYIICLNLFSDKEYYNYWTLLSNNDEKLSEEKRTKARYSFNMLYVAITRAQTNLCFFDEKVVDSLDEILKLQQKTKLNLKDLHFDNLSSNSEDFYEQAKKLEQEGLYEKAINDYKRAGKTDSSSEIIRCKMNLYIEKHNWEEATKYAILAKEFNLASKYSSKISDKNSKTKQLCEMFETKQFYIKNFSDLIDTVYSGFNTDNISLVYTLAINKAKELADAII